MDTLPTEQQGFSSEELSSLKNTKMNSVLAKGFLLGAVFFLIISLTGIYFILPPKNFPKQTFFKILPGQSVFRISLEAEEMGLVRSARVLQASILLLDGEHRITYGDYFFTEPVPVWEVARRLVFSDFNAVSLRVTIPEGMTRREMAETFDRILPRFEPDIFMEKTKDDEGMLFPDTYFFSPNTSTDEAITRLKKNYEAKLAPLREKIQKGSYSEREVVILASILEKEARGDTDRSMIAGVLMKRLSIGMPLQVDASFLFLLGKESQNVTKQDLEIDSPYNTYKYKGLPPGPINNPGLATIQAVLNPTETTYLYYLHDANGGVHFATTFAEHKKNKALYLK